MNLEDNSRLICSINNVTFSLFWMKTMCEGKSWYEKYGFELDPQEKKTIMNIRTTIFNQYNFCQCCFK